MAPSDRFQGFEDRARGAMLVVTEFSVQSYAKVEKDFSRRADAGGRHGADRARDDRAAGRPGAAGRRARRAKTASRCANGRCWRATDDMTAIVIAALPEAAKDAYPDAALRAALASVVIRAKLSSDDMLAVLPYRLGDLGGFRLLRASPDGTAVLTLGPNDTTLPGRAALLHGGAARRRAAAAGRARPLRAAHADRRSSTGPNCASSARNRCASAACQGHEIIAESARTSAPATTS